MWVKVMTQKMTEIKKMKKMKTLESSKKTLKSSTISRERLLFWMIARIFKIRLKGKLDPYDPYLIVYGNSY